MRGVLYLRLLAIPVLIVSALGLAPMAHAAALSVVGLNPLTTANDTNATVSGWADPGATVSLTVSDSGAGTVAGSAVGRGQRRLGDHRPQPLDPGRRRDHLRGGVERVPASYAATKNAASPPALYISSAPAVVNNASKTAVTISGVAPAAASVNLTISDGVPAHNITDTTTATGGLWSFTESIAGLTDGPITFTVASGSDTAVAPSLLDTATVVLISAPDYVNTTNVTSFSISGTGENGATIALVASDGSPPNATGAATVSGGTWSITGIDMSGLSDGTINYSVTATDRYGNTAPDSKSGIKDTVIPTLAMNAPPHPIIVSNVTTIVVSGSGQSGCTIEVTITDAGALHSVSGSATVASSSWTSSVIDASPLLDGTITYTARARDPAGNYSTPVTVTYSTPTTYKDTVLPAISILAYTNPINISNVSSASISGTGENGRPVTLTVADEHLHSVTRSGVTVSGGTWVFNGLDLTGLNDGDAITYTVAIRDPAQNPNTATSVPTAIKDTIAPALEITSAPTLINIANVGGVTVSGTGEDGRVVTLTVTDGLHTVYGLTTPTISGGVWSIATGSLSTLNDGGGITFAASVTDPGGNFVSDPAPAASKDTQAPTLAIPVVPVINIANASAVVVPGTSDQNGRPVTLTVTDEHGHSVTANPNPIVGSGTWSATLDLSSFTDGDDITYTASVTDANANTTTIYPTGTKDTSAPAVAITVYPVIYTANVGGVVVSGTGEIGATVTVTVTDQHLHTVLGLTTATVNGSGTWSITTANASSLLDGDVITYNATARDPSQNPTPATPQESTKDTSAPAVAITVYPVIYTGNVGGVVVSGTGEVGARVTVSVTDGHSNTVVGLTTPIIGAGGTWSITTANAGVLWDGDVITYHATATDPSENPTTATPRTSTKDTSAPAVAITVYPVIYTGNVGGVVVSGTGEVGARVTVSVTDGHSNTVVGLTTPIIGAGGTWSITTANAGVLWDGDVITYHATATDPSENPTTATPRTSTKDTSAPAVAITVYPVIYTGNVGGVVVSGTGEVGARVTVSVTDGHSNTVVGLTTPIIGAGGTWSITTANAGVLWDGDVITYHATATDPSENPTTATPRTSTKDTSAPAVAITVYPVIYTGNVGGVVVSGTGEVGARVTVSVTDGHSNTVVGLTTPIIGAGGTWSITTANAGVLWDGDVITYHATATDPSENPTTATPRTSTKDTGVPTVLITSAPSKINLNNVGGVVVSGTGENGCVVTLSVYDMNLHTVAGLTTPTVSGGVWSITTANASSLLDGDVITYSVTIRDASQNTSAPVTAFATKDTVAPALAISTAPNKINLGNVAGVTLTGTGENGNTVVLTVTDESLHTVSGLTTPTVSGGFWSISTGTLSNLLDGDAITYTVVATEASGNTTPRTSPAMKDTLAPALAITSAPAEIKISNVASITVSGTGENGREVTLTVTDQSLHSVPGIPKPIISGNAWSISGLNLGGLSDNDTITFTASVTDPGDNTVTRTATATKDTIAPTLDITVAPAQIKISNVGSITVSGTSDANGRTVTLAVTDNHGHSLPGSAVVGSGSWTISGLNLSTLTDDDPIVYTASVSDAIGNPNSDTAAAIKDTVINLGINTPVVIYSGNVSAVPISGTADTDIVQVSVTLTDSGTGTVTQASVPVVSGLWSTSINASGLAQGAITVHVNGSDDVGNPASPIASTTKDTVFPTLNFTAPVISFANASAVVVSGTSDANTRTVNLTVTDQHGHSVPASPIVGSGTWTSTLNLSSFTDGDDIIYSATVTDAAGNLTPSAPVGIKDTVINIHINSVTIINAGNVSAVPINGTADDDVLPFSVTLTDSGTGSVTRTGVAVVGGVWSTTINATGLADGPITVRAHGFDDVSNEASPTVSATKNLTAPSLNIPTVPKIVIANASAVVVLGTSDANGQPVTLIVEDEHGHSVTANPSPIVGGGAWSATLDLSDFIDGDDITYNASVTDTNGNTATSTPRASRTPSAPTLDHPGHAERPRQQRLGGRRLGHQ